MGGGGGRGDERSCVVVVHNLAMGEVNCDRLFNLVCQYGNVTKIFFMKTKPGCAMMEMSDHEGAQRVISNIQGTFLFGNKIQLDLSKKHIRITNAPLEFQLNDGSSSVKDYLGDRRLNRFNTKEMAESNIEEMFSSHCAPPPNKIKFVESKKERDGAGEERTGVGLAYFNTVEEATEALVLVNHTEINGKIIKLCFSPATY